MDVDIIKKSLEKNQRKSDKIGFIGEDDEFSKYAVAIPLMYKDNELMVLFQMRAKSLKHQPGEVSFPGGRLEENENSIMAARRETCEELNITSGDIETLGNLDIMITQHNKIIYPYVIRLEGDLEIKPSENEVDHVFFVPLKFFLQNKPIIKTIRIYTEPEEEFPYGDMAGAMEYKWIEGRSRVYIYKYENYIIWGLTAKIMNHFTELIREAL